MLDKMVTLLRFSDLIEASLARNRLTEAGIEAVLNNEEGASLGWQPGASTIELLVLESSLESAREALRYRDLTPEDRNWIAESHPNGVVEAEAASRRSEGITTPDMVEEEEPEADPYEEKIDRAFRAALLGVAFFPVEFYAFYLLFGILTDERPLPAERSYKVWLGLFLSVPLCLLTLLLCWYFIGPG